MKNFFKLLARMFKAGLGIGGSANLNLNASIATAVTVIGSASLAFLYYGGLTLLSNLLQNMLTVVLGIYVAVPTGLLISFCGPGLLVARTLRNQPFYMDGQTAKPSTFGFFTALTPGQVKIIERGERFITCLMRYPGHTFRGFVEPNIQVNSREYWEVIVTPQGYTDALPIHRSWRWWKIFYLPFHFVWYWSKIWIYEWTGMVFTGIAPWQTVRIYPIEYFKEMTTADGVFTLERKKNFSDHFRVAASNFFIPVGSADTANLVPVNMIIGTDLRITNPWLAAYAAGNEGWPTWVYSTVSSTVNDTTRQVALNEVLAGKTKTITDNIVALGSEKDPDALLRKFGITIDGATTPDRSVVSENKMTDTQKRLAAAAFAQAAADAREIEATAEAGAVTTMAKAVNKGGDGARLAMETEARIRSVEAAKGTNIAVIGSGGPSNTEALLAALLNQGRQK